MKRLVLLAAVGGVCLLLLAVTNWAQTPFGGDDSGCVPDTKDHLTCSNKIAKAFGKLVTNVAKCHIRQATAAFNTPAEDDETCETAAKSKFEASANKILGKCSTSVIVGASGFESVLLAPKTNPQSLDAQNAGPYCDGTADIDPSGDDAGKIPLTANGLKCANGVTKNLAKLVKAVLKCHAKMATSGFQGGTTDDESCEGTALGKFDAAAAKIVSLCPPCLSMANQDALANDATTGVIEQADGANVFVYPCPTTTTTSTTTPATTTTLGCCSPQPSRLSFTTDVAAGNCGTVQNNTGFVTLNLACGGVYFGGGNDSVPLPTVAPDMTQSLLAVTACSGSSLTLGSLTSAQTGSNRNCTDVGCLLGAPVPIPNAASPATSTCGVNSIAAAATGTADCMSGAIAIVFPVKKDVYISGDLFPNAPGIQPCPVCNHTCNAGTNNTGPCNTDADCPSGVPGSCTGAIVCHGGPNNGVPCTPADTNEGNGGPTSQDCPPSAMNLATSLALSALGTTGASSRTAVNNPASGQSNVFCGFCRDGANTTCFEGDPGSGCPRDAACTGGGTPFPCCTGSGTGTCSSFTTPKTCTSNGNCTDGGGTWPDCVQRNSGAFGLGASAHTITETGVPGGNLTDGLAHVARLVDVFCIPPSFNPTVDSAVALPGPGAVSAQGHAQLLP